MAIVTTAQTRDLSQGSSLLRIVVSVIAGLGATWAWLSFAPAILAAFALENPALSLTLFYAGLFAPLALLGFLLAWVCRVPVVPAGRDPAIWTCLGLLAGAGGLSLAIGLSWLNGAIVHGEGAPVSAGLILLGIVLILVQTGSEEVLLRGWLQPALGTAMPAVLAIALASLAFMVLHMAARPVGWLELPNMFLAGILFGALRHRTGGLPAPIAAHFGWNASEDLFFGAFPNTGFGPFGSILDIDFLGAAHWGGSEVGLNSSVGTTFVLLALIALVSARSRSQ